jgi:cell division transport system permease protein
LPSRKPLSSGRDFRKRRPSLWARIRRKELNLAFVDSLLKESLNYRILVFFAEEALGKMRKERVKSALTILVIAFALFTVGAFFLLAGSLRGFFGNVKDDVSLSVFMKDQASADAIRSVRTTLAASPIIERFESFSGDQTLKRFEASFPELSRLPQEIDANPFPATFDIKLKKRCPPDAARKLCSELEKMKGVDEVYYRPQIYQKIAAVTRAFRVSAVVFGGVLLLAALFSISNVIRVSVSEYRDEIELMSFSGVSPAFIKGTYILSGIFQGLAGAAVAILVLALVYGFFFRSFFVEAALFFPFLRVSFLSPALVLLLLLMGLAIGWIGSAFALRKLIRL